MSELAIPILKKEKLESNPPGFDNSEQGGSSSAPSGSGCGKPSEAPVAPVEQKVDEGEKSEPDKPPGDFGVRAKEEHTEEKDPVELVKAESQDVEIEGVEGVKKKKRRKKHVSGTSTKREKKRTRRREKPAEEERGAGSTGATLQDPTATTEEKDQLVAEQPQKCELKPAPKGSVAKHFKHCDLPPPPPAPKRPRSPDYPPPDHRDRREPRGQQRHWRERSRSLARAPQRKRGTKGVKHRERGRYWPYQRR